MLWTGQDGHQVELLTINGVDALIRVKRGHMQYYRDNRSEPVMAVRALEIEKELDDLLDIRLRFMHFPVV